MKLHTLLHCLNRRDFRLIPKISKKLKVTLIMVLIFGAFVLAKTNLAQSSSPNPTPTVDPAIQQKFVDNGKALKQKQDAMYKGNNQESWIGEALGSNAMAGINMLTGPIPFNDDGSIKVTGYAPGGALGTTTKFISSLYQPPASGVEYIAQVKDSFLGKPAYAQGIGFPGLSPLLPLWKTLRNIVYVLSSLIFVGIGVAIILRIKISPQAVISIQNSIPKLITALILVTFSYAIAGLLIDISYLFLGLCLAILFVGNNKSFNVNVFDDVIFGGGIPLVSWLGNLISLGVQAISGNYQYSLNNLTNANFMTFFSLCMKAIPSTTGWALGAFIGNIFFAVLLGGVGSTVLGDSGQFLLGNAGGGIGSVVGGVLGIILIPIIVALLLVIWMLKFYFGLIKCYITLIFKIVIAPLEIGLGALPNSKIGFSSWLKDVVANLAVFPVSILFMVFINYIMQLIGGNVWKPSLLEMPLLLADSGALISAGIGLAGLGMMAKLPKLVPEAIFSIKPSPFGAAIGEGYKGFASGAGKFAKSNMGAGLDAADKKYGDEAAGSTKFQQAIAWANRLNGGRSGERRRENRETTNNNPTPNNG